MTLSNFEINIISQFTLGLASIVGLLYKTCHYKKIWDEKYNIRGHELKSSLILSSCKLIWGMMVCHIFNLFSANIHCDLLLDNALTYYPMYTLITSFELGCIFIEPHIINLYKKIGHRYDIIGLKYPDIYPNLIEVLDIKHYKIYISCSSLLSIISICFYLDNYSNKSLIPLFIILSILGSFFTVAFLYYPFLIESSRNGQKKIKINNNEIYYIDRKDLIINISSWILIKVLMKSIWISYIINSSLRENMCILAQNGVFFNKITNAMFYMVGCSMGINIISVCYQYIFMNGDKIKTTKYIKSKCLTFRNRYLKKILKHSINLCMITFFSSIVWIFYIIEKSRGKNVNIDKNVLAIAITIFPWLIYVLILIIKYIVLYAIQYDRNCALLTLSEYSEL